MNKNNSLVSYSGSENGISLDKIDDDVLKIIRKLHKFKYESYIVGGAVRDLLVGIKPRDFDVVTNASPRKIKLLFRNARIIGRRFKLVHIMCAEKKYVEVSTFRSIESTNFNNKFGNIEDDVKKRDFTINALYYSPLSDKIFDFVDGMNDIKERRLREIIPREEIFKEDPLRIIRAIKYAVKLNMKIDSALLKQIKKERKLLDGISNSRITEEFYKMIKSCEFKNLYEELLRLKIAKYINTNLYLSLRFNLILKTKFLKNLSSIKKLLQDEQVERKELIYRFLQIFLEDIKKKGVMDKSEVIIKIKKLIYPVIFANYELEYSVDKCFKEKMPNAKKSN